MDRGAWQATVHRVTKSQTRLFEHKTTKENEVYHHNMVIYLVSSLSCAIECPRKGWLSGSSVPETEAGTHRCSGNICWMKAPDKNEWAGVELRHVDLVHHTRRIKKVQRFVSDETIADMEVWVFGSTRSQMSSLGWPWSTLEVLRPRVDCKEAHSPSSSPSVFSLLSFTAPSFRLAGSSLPSSLYHSISFSQPRISSSFFTTAPSLCLPPIHPLLPSPLHTLPPPFSPPFPPPFSSPSHPSSLLPSIHPISFPHPFTPPCLPPPLLPPVFRTPPCSAQWGALGMHQSTVSSFQNDTLQSAGKSSMKQMVTSRKSAQKGAV